jgi:hypothetical protein
MALRPNHLLYSGVRSRLDFLRFSVPSGVGFPFFAEEIAAHWASVSFLLILTADMARRCAEENLRPVNALDIACRVSAESFLPLPVLDIACLVSVEWRRPLKGAAANGDMLYPCR